MVLPKILICKCGGTLDIEYDHDTGLFFVECIENECEYEREDSSNIKLIENIELDMYNVFLSDFGNERDVDNIYTMYQRLKSYISECNKIGINTQIDNLNLLRGSIKVNINSRYSATSSIPYIDNFKKLAEDSSDWIDNSSFNDDLDMINMCIEEDFGAENND